MSVCKLCKEEAQLIKAHIIPKSFWEVDPVEPLRMLTNTVGQRPKRSRIGVYDNTIVCEACEKRFGDWDTYAAQILLNEAHKFSDIKDARGRVLGRYVSQIDYRKLKLFCIAVLWRSGVSSHPYYRKVQLGNFVERARGLLLDADPGDPDVFGTVFASWRDIDWPLHMDPFDERWDGIRYYRYYLGRYLVYIKVDSRRIPKIFSNFLLSPNQPLVVIPRNLHKSKELSLIRRIATIHSSRISPRHRDA